MRTLRFLTCGSVDDGKSTLIGRLLFDSGLVPEDQLAALWRDSARQKNADGRLDYSLLVDGLEAEREQGITIDVAYRFFSTRERSFIVADAPGHEQYTRNMATAASTADLAILLVDARSGLIQQTHRHIRICKLFGIRHMILAVNKMDLVDFSQRTFVDLELAFKEFVRPFDLASTAAIPLCATSGDNVVIPSTTMQWYRGPTLLSSLVELDVSCAPAVDSFRFPVQQVNKLADGTRALAGAVVAGSVEQGQKVAVLPSGQRTRISRILSSDGDVQVVNAGTPAMLVFDNEIDAGRGDLVVSEQEPSAHANDQFAAHVLWTAENSLLPGRSYLLRIGHNETPGSVTALRYRIDVNTGEHIAARQLAINEIGYCHVSTTALVAFDSYAHCRATGSFIIIDRQTNETAGAGIIDHVLRRSENVREQTFMVGKDRRSNLMGQKPAILWFTGLSGAGKSTIANLVEGRLLEKRVHTYLLDGDNVRLGLNRDLGFTIEDRIENIRRVGEVARLFVDAGLIVLCAFISPFASERAAVRARVDAKEFVEIFIDTPFDVCRARDPKGLYAKASAGNVSNFTGFDSPYEPPIEPEITIKTHDMTAEEAANVIISWLVRHEHIA